MSAPLVSIITPTYNHERFIAECIESALAQTYTSWEMLIVDDGSTDGTWAIVQAYAARDARIRAFRQENKGIWRLAETYNFALALARGELIAILEGDDYWPAHKLAIQVQFHQTTPGLILSHGRSDFVEQGAVIGANAAPPLGGIRSSRDYLRLALLGQSAILPVTALIRKDILLTIDGFHQEHNFPAVDYPTWVRFFEQKGDVAWIDQLLGHYRISQSQITQLFGQELAETQLRIAQERFDQLPRDLVESLGLTRQDISRSLYENKITPGYVFYLRQALIRKDRKKIISYALKLLRYGSGIRKLQGIYALLAAPLGLNMESILVMYERLVLRRNGI